MDWNKIIRSIDDFLTAHPTNANLVVEVSLTTLAEDREMAGIYAQAGILEYWLINLNNSTVEVYSDPVGGRYAQMKTYLKTENLSPHFSPEIIINLPDVF